MTVLKNYINKRSMFTVFGVGFGFVALAAIVLTVITIQNLTSTQVDQEVMTDTEIIANMASDHINQVMWLTDELLENTANALVVIDDDEEFNQVLKELDLSNSIFTRIEVLDENGEVIQTSHKYDLDIGMSRRSELSFQNINEGNETSIDKAVFADETGATMTMAKRAGDKVLIGYINFHTMYESLSSYVGEYSRTFNIVITDEFGIYLAGIQYDHINQRRRFAQFDEFKAELENNGSTFSTDIGDERYIVSSARFSINSWYLFVYEDTTTLQERFWNSAVTPASLLVAIIVIMGLAYMGFMRYLKKYILEFADKTESISHGDYEGEIKGSTFKEFNTLSRHFNKMSSAIKERNNQLYHIAYYDSLTGLVTRTKVYEEFLKEHKNAAFAYIDLNKFKSINDTYGHRIGDDILRQLGDELNNTFNRPNEMIARIGGDELLLVIFNYESKEYVQERLSLIKELEDKCFTTNEISMYLSFSIGVSYYPDNGDNFEYLMSCADIAMYDLRNTGRGEFFREYTHDMRLRFDRKTILSTSIVNAINSDEFGVVYQPIVDLKQNKIRGFEVLSRWNHHELGEVTPVEFIRILEDKELIHKLDFSVLAKASHDIDKLRAKSEEDLILSINFSAITLSRSDFFEEFVRMVEENKINTSLLEIEITESALISDFEYIKKVIKELSDMGISVSEDDFGTGYSSLNYLLRLDLSTLKIPREFLDGYNSKGKSSRIINSLVTLSNELGLKVVIEGVEDVNQADVFREIGVDYLQGFYYSRPMVFDKALSFISEQK